MALTSFRGIYKRSWQKYTTLQRTNLLYPCSSVMRNGFLDIQLHPRSSHSNVSVASNDIQTSSLAEKLACLVDETCHVNERKPRNHMELKRYFELRIKKRVKEHYVEGKFRCLMEKVIDDPKTLEDAYKIICLNSNIDIASISRSAISFGSIAEDLQGEKFDIKSNIFMVATRGSSKDVLFLPNLKLKVIKEAIRIVLEVVYRPHSSKISHGCRTGRGHSSAMKYISKDISNPSWWFTLNVTKKLDDPVLAKLVSIMEEKIDDPALYAFIRSLFHAQVLNLEFGGFPKGQGLPQEGVLSPVLINIYLNHFDSEFYRLSMTYEALAPATDPSHTKSISNLRLWFRRQLKGSEERSVIEQKSITRIHSIRFMDEIFFAVSGSKEVALELKSDVVNYLQSTLHLDVDTETEVLPSDGPHGVRFLGFLVRRTVKETPAVRAVHKLKEKVDLFASQKEAAWSAGTIRIGKKWLAHGLKKVKESEIKGLADETSVLNQISSFRKPGMETDHWYKYLLKNWMHSINAKSAENEETILSKYVAEPALPRELTESFYAFQKLAQEYVASETASTLNLLPNSPEVEKITQVIAPISVIKKRLLRYGLVTSRGFARSGDLLVLLDTSHIIDWYAGVVLRWHKWYRNCSNFDDIRQIISDSMRKSCVRTLAVKYRIHETEIEKKFSSELSGIPLASDEDMENEMTDSLTFSQIDEALMYGVPYSGTCLLSFARTPSSSRPCNCFVYGCLLKAPSVYTLNVMERQKFPGWKTGFASCIHPSLNKRRIALCDQHLKDLFLGHISLQSIDFGSWTKGDMACPASKTEVDICPVPTTK